MQSLICTDWLAACSAKICHCAAAFADLVTVCQAENQRSTCLQAAALRRVVLVLIQDTAFGLSHWRSSLFVLLSVCCSLYGAL